MADVLHMHAAHAALAVLLGLRSLLDRATDPVIGRMASEFKSEMEGDEFRTLKLRGVLPPGEDPLERIFGADLVSLQTRWEDYVRGLV